MSRSGNANKPGGVGSGAKARGRSAEANVIGVASSERRSLLRFVASRPLNFGRRSGSRQRVTDEAVDQLRVADPERLHDFWVHADVGEAWQGVHLIDDEAAVLAQKKVDAGQALAAERAEGLDREFADLVADVGGEVSGDLDRRALLVEIFGLIGVEAVTVAGHDLARRRGGERTVLTFENAALDLAAADIFLDQDLAVVPERLGDRFSELLSRPRLADADRRALARWLDEHRAAKFGDDLIERWRLPLGEA